MSEAILKGLFGVQWTDTGYRLLFMQIIVKGLLYYEQLTIVCYLRNFERCVVL
jgi:hypothetical protein